MCLLLPATARPIERFEARMAASKWQVSATRLVCRLSHTIPRYGKAEFVQRSGQGGLTFVLHTARPLLHKVSAVLSAEPPVWKHGALVRQLGTVDLSAGARVMQLNEGRARELLKELEAGMFPTLSYSGAGDASAPAIGRDGDVRIALSAVNFRAALQDFLDCRRQLVAYDFKAVRESVLHFAHDSANLDESARDRLAKVALFARVDQRLEQLSVRGFADARGTRRYNRGLSRRRALTVKHYLVKHGVAADKVRVSYFGEKHSVETNVTPAGRAANRRVVVILHQ